MKKVLVPYDGSPPALRALHFVLAQEAEARPREIHVVNVQPIPIVPGDFAAGKGIFGLRDGSIAQARLMLAFAEAVLSESGTPFQSHIRFGDAAPEIIAQASQLDCDHIVMATHGDGALKNWVLGSVATKVVHLATIPVTLVK